MAGRTSMKCPYAHSTYSPGKALRGVQARTGVLCVLALITLPGCQRSDTPQEATPAVWRFALEEAEGSVQHAYALRFKELIEARTDGQINIVIYPYGSLGTSTQITEQLSLGVIEFAMASPGSLGKFIPELQVFLLHFLLPEDARRTQQILNHSGLVNYFDRLYAPKGLKLLSIFAEGEMVWTLKKEVRTPADFRGVKMRVMTSPLLLAAYEAYGASPTPMPYSEVYSALQLNMVDGQVNPIFAIERQTFHEVTSWLIFPGHASFIATCAANREFFRNLSPEHKELISSIVAELDEYIFEVQTRLQSERLKTIVRDKKRQQSPLMLCLDSSVFLSSLTSEEHTELVDNNPYLRLVPGLTSSERQQFRDASRQVRSEFVKIGGPQGHDVLQLLEDASAER